MLLTIQVDTSKTLREQRDTAERIIIATALGKHRGKKAAAARALGISRVQLYKKLRKLKADPIVFWTPCPCCENYWCNLHKKHAFECACPPIEEWQADPYSPIAEANHEPPGKSPVATHDGAAPG